MVVDPSLFTVNAAADLGQYLASTGFSVRVFTHLGVNVFHFNRPYDTRHLCMHPRIDGIFAMSRDFSGDEH